MILSQTTCDYVQFHHLGNFTTLHISRVFGCRAGLIVLPFLNGYILGDVPGMFISIAGTWVVMKLVRYFFTYRYEPWIVETLKSCLNYT